VVIAQKNKGEIDLQKKIKLIKEKQDKLIQEENEKKEKKEKKEKIDLQTIGLTKEIE